jgi:hypothetical protein
METIDVRYKQIECYSFTKESLRSLRFNLLIQLFSLTLFITFAAIGISGVILESGVLAQES